MEFREIQKKALSEAISLEILEMIKAKKLTPGDKLPPERDLASQMGISRPSLREALRALSLLNVIEIRQGDGIYISSLSAVDMLEHLEFVFSIDNSTVKQLFEARKIIEPGVARIAALKAQGEDIDILRELGHQSRIYPNELEKFLQIDLEIHTKIVQIANNPFLNRINSSLTFLSKASRLQTGRIPGVMHQTVTDHDAIIQAIADHNPDGAYAAMLQHLSHVESSFLQSTEIIHHTN